MVEYRVTRHQAEPEAIYAQNDWQALPRLERDAVLELMHAPERASARTLLRSTTFNPTDIVLATQDGEDLDSLIQRHMTAIAALAAQHADTLAVEFMAAHHRGRTATTELTSLEGRSNLLGLGPRPVLRILDGVPYGAPRPLFPRSNDLDSQRATELTLLVSEVADLFLRRRTLTEEQAAAIRNQASGIASKCFGG